MAMLTGVLIRVGAVCIIIVMLGAIFWCTSNMGSILAKAEWNMR